MKHTFKALASVAVAAALVIAPLGVASAYAEEVPAAPVAEVVEPAVVEEAPAAEPVVVEEVVAEPVAVDESVAETPGENDSIAVQSYPQPSPSSSSPPEHKWYVCKYVGTPGVDERLQTGDNPIWTDEHSIETYPNIQIGDTFSDAHTHSVVIAGPYDKKVTPEPSAADCPAPEGPDPEVSYQQKTEDVCTEPLDGTRTFTTYQRSVTRAYVLVGEEWVLGDPVYGEWEIFHTETKPDATCEPPDEPIEVIPTLSFEPPTCDAQGSVLVGPEEGVMWSAVLNEDGSTRFTAEPAEGYAFPEDAQTEWIVPDLAQLDPESEECFVPEEPTLDGTFITPVCVDDAAYLRGLIALDDPDGQVDPTAEATITLTDGVHSFTYPQTFPIGEINVLWPGASVDPSTGMGVTWPGYITNPDGTYTATDDPAYFGWTRGGVTVHVEVNPETEVEVDYPLASPLCLTSPPEPTPPPAPPTLAVTGVDPMGPLAGGAALVLSGIAALIWRRVRA